ARKFGEILGRNQTPDLAIAAHHDLLEQQLRQQAETLRISGDSNGYQLQLAAAVAVNQTKNELLTQRAINDADAFEQAAGGQGYGTIAATLRGGGHLSPQQAALLHHGRLT